MGLARPEQPVLVVEENLDELAELARSAEFCVVGRSLQRRKSPHPKTFIGRGKAQELATAGKELSVDVVIFDEDLSASQVKNLEGLLECAVMDRSALILELFQMRARTREAKTQVELARLSYLLPRLTRRWSHLSRQVGGIGVRGGEGETQLEADRRMLRTRIKQLKKDLAKIEKTRDVQRRGRRDTPVVALAGYTNAGKSTLFNRLTHAGVLAQDRLFATLDPRLRKGSVGNRGEAAIFADTVGFIRKLPHHLVASFRSTLEEVVRADVVLHVIDRSHPMWRDQMKVAEEVLEELGVERGRVLRVFNKVDLVEETAANSGSGPLVSAISGQGIDGLKTEIQKMLNGRALARAARSA